MKIFNILFFVCLSYICSAQESTEYDRRVGIDITQLLDRLLFSDGISSDNAYLFSYRKKGKKQGYFRFGAGLTVQAETFGGGVNAQSTQLDLRFGRDKLANLSRRWQVNYGWDIKTVLTYNKSASVTDGTLQTGLGFAPVAGVFFRIHPRLSLSTEAAYDIFFLITTKKEEPTTTLFSSRLAPPFFVMLNYDF